MITLITPTGDRPEVFELCRKWIRFQTKQPDQWIVVDDGYTPMPEELRTGVEYVRREPKEGEGHTLTLNLKMAVPLIKGDKILIIEDDDWYGPNYIETMDRFLSKSALVGECFARYYHVPTMRHRRIGNNKHASLCQTGFTKALLPYFVKCLEGDPYVDARFWAMCGNQGHVFSDTEDKLHLQCSMKGLKGRKGIGTGHDESARYYLPDNHIANLIAWVGEENAKIYMKHVGQSFASARLIGSAGRHLGVMPIPSSRRVFAPEVSAPNPGITVITCTGDRLDSFLLLHKWMKNQTLKPSQWLVIDDGKEPIPPLEGFEGYRREPTPNDFPHTLCQNMLVALGHVAYDKIIIMEDDDWYHPTYIDYMSKLLDTADLVGFRNLLFYYPSTGKYMEKGSVKQPAFAQTAFRKNIIPVLEKICKNADKEWQLSGKGLIDMFLWADPLDYDTKTVRIRLTTALKGANGKVVPKGLVFDPPFPASIIRRAEKNNGAEFFTQNTPVKATKKLVICDTYLSVGMKGLPGRKGLTTQHDIGNQRYKIDAGYKLLKSILKSDSDFYIKKST
jgi:hypothetical protein